MKSIKFLLCTFIMAMIICMTSCSGRTKNPVETEGTTESVNTIKFEGEDSASEEDMNNILDVINKVLILKETKITMIQLTTSPTDSKLHLFDNESDINAIIDMLAADIDTASISNTHVRQLQNKLGLDCHQVYLQSGDETVLSFLFGPDGVWTGDKFNIYIGNKITESEYLQKYKTYLK